jgi:hypothetical protein
LRKKSDSVPIQADAVIFGRERERGVVILGERSGRGYFWERETGVVIFGRERRAWLFVEERKVHAVYYKTREAHITCGPRFQDMDPTVNENFELELEYSNLVDMYAIHLTDAPSSGTLGALLMHICGHQKRRHYLLVSVALHKICEICEKESALEKHVPFVRMIIERNGTGKQYDLNSDGRRCVQSESRTFSPEVVQSIKELSDQPLVPRKPPLPVTSGTGYTSICMYCQKATGYGIQTEMGQACGACACRNCKIKKSDGRCPQCNKW